jgi:hypothetical protein
MNDSRVMPRPRRAWPPMQTAAAIIITAALALPAAACSSSGSSTGSDGSPSARGSSSSPSAVVYSSCMRSHGVPNFPDPGSSGQLPKADPQQLGVGSSQLQAAQRACQLLLPNNGAALSASSLEQCELSGDCPRALVQQAMTQLRNFSQCMRSHGVPNWPDPTIDTQGRPGLAISISKDGFDPDSPQIDSRTRECEHVMHPDTGVPRAVSR